MADVKISALPLATTPLAGTEVLPIVQSATTDQVSVANLTAGRAVSASSLTLTTTPLAVGSGGTGLSTLTAANYALYSTSSSALTAGTLPVAAGGTGTATAFTAGSVVFAGTSGVYSQDNSQLFWDNTNNRLGVGTATPSYALDVNGTINSSSGVIRVAGNINPYLVLNDGTYNAYLQITNAVFNAYTASIPMTFSPGASEKMRLTSDGNLGLGVTPSAWSAYRALQIASTGGALSSSSSSDLEITTNAYNAGAGWLSQGAGVASSRYRLYAGTHVWYTAPSSTAGSAITFTQAMTLDASGYLTVGNITGAGTSQITAYGATNGQIAVQNSTNWSRVLQNSNDLYIDNGVGGSGGNIIFRQGSGTTERARIDTSGNLLVGTASSPTSGTQCLTIETGTAATASPADTITVYSTDLSAGNTMLSLYTEGTSVNANTTAAATHRIAIRVNGTVYYLLANTSA